MTWRGRALLKKCSVLSFVIPDDLIVCLSLKEEENQEESDGGKKEDDMPNNIIVIKTKFLDFFLFPINSFGG